MIERERDGDELWEEEFGDGDGSLEAITDQLSICVPALFVAALQVTSDQNRSLLAIPSGVNMRLLKH